MTQHAFPLVLLYINTECLIEHIKKMLHNTYNIYKCFFFILPIYFQQVYLSCFSFIFYSEAIYQTLGELRHLNGTKEPRDLVGGETYNLLTTLGFDVVEAMNRRRGQIQQPSSINICSNSSSGGNSLVGDVNVCSDDSRKVVNPFSIENILADDRGSARGRPLPSHFVTQPAGFLVRSPAGSYQSSDVSPSDYSAPSSPERRNEDSDSDDDDQGDGDIELRLRLQEGEDRNVMVVPARSPFQEQNSNDTTNINNLQQQNASAGSLMHRS